MLTIIKYTVKEMIRKRALLLIIVLTAGFLIIYGYGLHLIFSDTAGNTNFNNAFSYIQYSQLLSAGLYFSSFIVAFLTVLTSFNAISGDIESTAIYAVLVKPINRYEVVLGKFIGYGIMITVYNSIFFLTIIGLNIAMGSKLNLPFVNILKAMFYFDLGPLAFLSFVICMSSIFSTVNTGIISVMAYGIAMIGGILEQIGTIIPQGHGQDLINAGIITSLIMPTDVIFRKMTSELLTTSEGVSFLTNGPFGGLSQPSPYMIVYIFAYIAFLIIYGSIKFSRRDL